MPAPFSGNTAGQLSYGQNRSGPGRDEFGGIILAPSSVQQAQVNRFGDSPADQSFPAPSQRNPVNRFGDSGTGPQRDEFGGILMGSSPALSPDQRFQNAPSVQQAADTYVQQKWDQYGATAMQSEGQAIRDFAIRMGSGMGDRANTSLPHAVSYVKSTLTPEQTANLETQWRHEYLANALGDAVSQQQAAATPAASETPEVGPARGLIDAAFRGTANIITKPVEAGTQLFYALGEHHDNSGLHGANASLSPNELRQLASIQAVGHVQQNIEQAYPRSTAAEQGSRVQQVAEGAAEMLPQLVLTGRAFSAGGLQKALAMTQMGSSGFGDSYQSIYNAAKQNGMNDQDANAAATAGGVIDAVANTYLMKFGALGQTAGKGGLLRRIVTLAAKDALAQGAVGGGQGLVNEATNFIATGKSPKLESILDNAIQNAGAGVIFGTSRAAIERPAGNTSGQEPYAAEAGRTVPVPNAQTLASLMTAPPKTPPAGGAQTEAAAAPQPSRVQEPKSLPPILEGSTPKYRLTTGGVSRGIPVEFQSPVEKAAWFSTLPVRGKLSVEADKYLSSVGVTPEAAKLLGEQLRNRADNLAKNPPDPGQPLRLTAAAEAESPLPPNVSGESQQRPLPPEYRVSPRPAGPTPIPEEIQNWSNDRVRQWAASNGYGLDQLTGVGKAPLIGELRRQYAASLDRPRVLLPEDAATWDAGRLRRWAEVQGIQVPPEATGQRADRPDERPRVRLYNFLKKVTEGAGAGSAEVLRTTPEGTPVKGQFAGTEPGEIQSPVATQTPPSRRSLEQQLVAPPELPNGQQITRGRAAAETPAPFAVPEQSQTVRPEPQGHSGESVVAEVPSLPPVIAKAKPKFPVRTARETVGAPVTFASDTDKALYLATTQKRGKIAAEAQTHLQRLGYSPEQIESEGAALRERMGTVAKHGQLEDGDTLHVPTAGAENAGPVAIPQDTRPRISTAAKSEPTAPEQRPPTESVPPLVSETPSTRPAELAEPRTETVSQPAPKPRRRSKSGVLPVVPDYIRSGSMRDIREWAAANGYDAERLAGLGSNRVFAELSRQRVASLGEPVAHFLPADETVEKPVEEHQSVLSEYNPGAKVVGRESLPPEHREVLDVARELTGKDAVAYMGGKGRGFHVGDVYYNVDRNRTPHQRREAIAHEATHWLQDNRPQLVDRLEQAIPQQTRRQLLNEYQRMYARQEGGPLSPEQHAREIQAMAVGRAFARPSVARQVLRNSPGAFTRAADAIIAKLRSLTSGGRLTNEVVNFLRAARDQAAKIPHPAEHHLPESDVPGYLPSPDERVRREAEEYAREAGIPYRPSHDYAALDEQRSKQIADHYATLKHEPNNPQVRRSYDAFKRETLDQWNFLERKGIKFEPWNRPGQPYRDSADMMRDVRENKHLFFFQGGELPADHPLAEKAPGTPYTYNDVFRAVHDYFGHAKEGLGFGPRGEENAWRAHSQMYSDEARPAMTTETRGQNSWINFGPHGEHNRANPTQTVYAEQKAGILPEQSQRAEEAVAKSGGPGVPGKEAASPNFLPEDEDERNIPALTNPTRRQLLEALTQSTHGELRGVISGKDVHWFDAADDTHDSFGLKYLDKQPQAGNTVMLRRVNGKPVLDGFSMMDRNRPQLRGLSDLRATKENSVYFLPGTETARKFADEDVVPALKSIGERFADAWDGVKSLLAPQTRSNEAGTTARVIRERAGRLARETDKVHAAFDATEAALEKLPVAEQRAITDAAERGQKQSVPDLQPVADAIRQMYDDRLRQMQKLDPTFEGIANYMGHLYEDSAKATDWFKGAGRRPLEGDKSFLRKRTLPFQSDAIAAGHEPVTDNPVTMMKLKTAQMDKYIATHTAFNELKDIGLMKRVPAREAFDMERRGYARIDDNVGTIFAKPNRKGGVSIAGYWMAPEPVARVVNNYLSPGLRGSEKFGGLYRTYLGVGHVLNSVQLLSGFHLAFATIDTMASKLSLAFKQGYHAVAEGRADMASESAKSLGTWATMVGPVLQAFRNGNEMMKEWYKPGSTNRPDIAKAVEQYMIAGGRMHMGDERGVSWIEGMKKAAASGNYIGAAVRSPFALIEGAAKPLMEYLIPRLKAGVFYDMAMHELDALPSSADRDAVRKVMGEAQDSVDDRLGEMVYDNTFWDHTAKDVAMATTRSVGWNAGTARTFGGAPIDAAKLAGQIVSTRGLKGTRLTNRMAYAVAVPLTHALVGAVTYYLYNGKAPDTLKDLFFPKTGQKDKEGHDVRLSIPSYVKDLLEYGKDIKDFAETGEPGNLVRTLRNKAHPLLTAGLEMLTNEDYFGTRIRNEDDPFWKRLEDTGIFAAKQFEPFGSRTARKMFGEGQGAKSLLPLIGLNEARHDITNTDAENRAMELMRERPMAPRTQEQADRSKLVRELGDALHAGQPDARDHIREAFQEGKITEEDISHIRQAQNAPGLLERTVRHLDVRDAFKVWDEADAGERKRLGPIMLAKIRASKSATQTERAAYIRRFQSDWKALGTGPTTEEE